MITFETQNGVEDLNRSVNRMLDRQTIGSTNSCEFSPTENILHMEKSVTGGARSKEEMLFVTSKDLDVIIETYVCNI